MNSMADANGTSRCKAILKIMLVWVMIKQKWSMLVLLS